MLSRVDPNLRQPQALCICPTRELAIQNMEVLQKMGKFTGITAELAVPESNQVAVSLKDSRGPQPTICKREDLKLDSVKQYKVVCPREQKQIEVIKDQIMELGILARP
ncbi:DEAD-box ATP-dependent RNA helicase 38 [Raphanus sativus]|nr:DEAD-box ATP-dependent RNA helicase 38 [Raphanus sativus]